MELRAKNYRGSHNSRSEAVTTTHNQVRAVNSTSTSQPGNPDRAQGQWRHPASDVPHLGLTGLHPVERRQWNLPVHGHHHQGLCLVPIMTARCWQLNTRWEMWMGRRTLNPREVLRCVRRRDGGARDSNATSRHKASGLSRDKERNLVWAAHEGDGESLAARHGEEK